MNSHLVAIKVGVERGANQRMDLDGLAFDQDGLESLNAKPMQRRSTIEQDRMLTNNVFQDVPDYGFLTFDHLFRLLNRCRKVLLFELVIDKRLEELEGHFLRESALVELELRPHDDDRTTRVVHALAKQILAEPSLLSF